MVTPIEARGVVDTRNYSSLVPSFHVYYLYLHLHIYLDPASTLTLAGSRDHQRVGDGQDGDAEL